MQRQVTVAFQTDKALSAYGALAARAEAYGFDGVSVYNDMLYQPAWLPLLEIARQTKRIKIGPAAVNPFTSHPIEIAGNLALVDAASNGRAYCGFARGAWLDFVGLNPQKPIASLREALACVRHLLRRDKAPFRGEQFQLRGEIACAGKQFAPIFPFCWVAGDGRRYEPVCRLFRKSSWAVRRIRGRPACCKHFCGNK